MREHTDEVKVDLTAFIVRYEKRTLDRSAATAGSFASAWAERANSEAAPITVVKFVS